MTDNVPDFENSLSPVDLAGRLPHAPAISQAGGATARKAAHHASSSPSSSSPPGIVHRTKGHNDADAEESHHQHQKHHGQQPSTAAAVQHQQQQLPQFRQNPFAAPSEQQPVHGGDGPSSLDASPLDDDADGGGGGGGNRAADDASPDSTSLSDPYSLPWSPSSGTRAARRQQPRTGGGHDALAGSLRGGGGLSQSGSRRRSVVNGMLVTDSSWQMEEDDNALMNDDSCLGKIKRKLHEYKHLSLFLFDEAHPLRVRCTLLANNYWFNAFILVCIILNSLLLALKQPAVDNPPVMDLVLDILDYIFTAVFTIEMIIKVLAMGFLLHPGAYLRVPWNILDFLIVVSSLIGLFVPETGNFAVLRVGRVLRPLRSAQRVRRLRDLISAILVALPTVADNLLLFLFILVIFAITGLQIWAGKLTYRCYVTHLPPKNSTFYRPEYANLTVPFLVKNDEHNCGGTYQCPSLEEEYGLITRCMSDRNIFYKRNLNYDQIAAATLISLKIMVKDNWQDDLENLMDSTGASSAIYLVILTFIGSLVINLFVAILTKSYGNNQFGDFETVGVGCTPEDFPSMGIDDGRSSAQQSTMDSAGGGVAPGEDAPASRIMAPPIAAAAATIAISGDLANKAQGGRANSVGTAPDISASQSSLISSSSPTSSRKDRRATENRSVAFVSRDGGGDGGGEETYFISGIPTMSGSATPAAAGGGGSHGVTTDAVDYAANVSSSRFFAVSKGPEEQSRSDGVVLVVDDANAMTVTGRVGNVMLPSSLKPALGAAAASSAQATDTVPAPKPSGGGGGGSRVEIGGTTVVLLPADVSQHNADDAEGPVDQLDSSMTEDGSASPTTTSETGDHFMSDDDDDGPREPDTRMRWRKKLDRYLRSAVVQAFLVFVTIVNVATLAVDYYGITDEVIYITDLISLTCTAIFAFNMLLILIAEGRRAFKDPLHVVDMVVILLAIPEVVLPGSTLTAFSVLRVLRIIRFVKLLRIPSIQPLVLTVIDSVASMGYLALLILIFLYVFAILGMQLFGADYGAYVVEGVDTRDSFGTIWQSLLTAFIVLSGDNWVYRMRVGMANTQNGGEIVPVAYFSLLYMLGNAILINLSVAIILAKLTEKLEMLETTSYPPLLLLPKYIPAHEREIDGLRRRKDYSRMLSLQLFSNVPGGPKRSSSFSDPSNPAAAATNTTTDDDQLTDAQRYERRKEAHQQRLQMNRRLKAKFQDDVERRKPGFFSRMWNVITHVDTVKISGKSFFIFTPDNPFRVMIAYVCSSFLFERAIDLVILANLVILFFDSPLNSERTKDSLRRADIFFTSVFAAEMVMKMIAFGVVAPAPLRDSDLEKKDLTQSVELAEKRAAAARLEDFEKKQAILAASTTAAARDAGSVPSALPLTASSQNLLLPGRHSVSASPAVSGGTGLVPPTPFTLSPGTTTNPAAVQHRHSRSTTPRVPMEDDGARSNGAAAAGGGSSGDTTAPGHNNSRGSHRNSSPNNNASAAIMMARSGSTNSNPLTASRSTRPGGAGGGAGPVAAALERRSPDTHSTSDTGSNNGEGGGGVGGGWRASLTAQWNKYWIEDAALEFIVNPPELTGDEERDALELQKQLIVRAPYLRDPWNIVDFVVVALALVAFFVPVFRTARSLRAVRLMTRHEETKIIVIAIVEAIPHVMQGLVFVAFLFFILGVIGVKLFKGKFYSCTLPTVTKRSQCVGNLTQVLQGPVLPSPAQTVAALWQRSNVHFDHLGAACFALFFMMVGDNWSDLMYQGMDTISDEEIGQDASPWMAIYFVVAYVCCTFFALNMMIGILVNFFAKQKQLHDGSALLTPDQRRYVRARFAIDATLSEDMIARESRGAQLIKQFLTYRWEKLSKETPLFEIFMMGVIIINAAMLAAAHDGMPATLDVAIDMTGNVALGIFLIEIFMKAYTYGVVQYMSYGWNIFDVCVVFAGIATIFIPGAVGSGLSALRVIRLAKLVKGSGVEQLLRSIGRSFHSFTNVIALLILTFFVFAVAGVVLFGEVPFRPGGAITPNRNFQTVWNALLVLYQAASQEGWSELMDSCVVEDEPYCKADGTGVCIPYEIAVIYFVLFVVSCSFIVLQLFVAVVVEILIDDTDEEDPTVIAFGRLKQMWVERYGAGTECTSVFDFMDWLPEFPQELTEVDPQNSTKAMWIVVVNALNLPVDSLFRVTYRDIVNSLAFRKYKVDLRSMAKFIGDTVNDIVSTHETFTASQVICATRIQRRWKEMREKRLERQRVVLQPISVSRWLEAAERKRNRIKKRKNGGGVVTTSTAPKHGSFPETSMDFGFSRWNESSKGDFASARKASSGPAGGSSSSDTPRFDTSQDNDGAAVMEDFAAFWNQATSCNSGAIPLPCTQPQNVLGTSISTCAVHVPTVSKKTVNAAAAARAADVAAARAVLVLTTKAIPLMQFSAHQRDQTQLAEALERGRSGGGSALPSSSSGPASSRRQNNAPEEMEVIG